MRIKNILPVVMVALTAFGLGAQIVNPASWNFSIERIAGDRAAIVIDAKIDDGWHVYSYDVDPEVGPSPLELVVTSISGAKLSGGLSADRKPHVEYDDMFDADLGWWSGQVALRQPVLLTAPAVRIEGYVRYSACSDSNCIPPSKEYFSLEAEGVAVAATDAVAAAPAEPACADSLVEPQPVEHIGVSEPASIERMWWEPVGDAVSADGADESSSSDLWYVFWACFLGGFVALLTPCVWPMIPLTVSFFLKKGKSRARAVADALVYGVSIIVIYLLLGLLITALFGASQLNSLATSAVCNIIFFLLLVVFAVSFFGAFDIKLPARWSNSVDATAERTTGLLSIFFMAFTLTLVSFSCTGPIIGTLLVEAASTGDKLGPAIGMTGFALALAIPFCLFAIFPSWLKSAPRSGGWMNTVKVVLGFVELALSLKFLSVADLAYGWGILDREVFIALWVGLFILLGMYLLGVFAFSHYGSQEGGISTVRFLLAFASISFAIYLIPGLWGAPLKGVSAFVPPLYTQDFNLYGSGVQEYDDFDQGMRAALKEGKPAFVDFSGYGCVNCRKMEGAVLDAESVRTLLENDFVVITLMVDDKRPLPQPLAVEENGKKIVLDTYGDKWSYLQRSKFRANAQPYYVVLDPADGSLLSGPYSYDENVDRFLLFLNHSLPR